MKKQKGNSVFQNDQKLVVIITINVSSSKLHNLSLVIVCTYLGLLLNLGEPFQVSFLMSFEIWKNFLQQSFLICTFHILFSLHLPHAPSTGC